MHIQSNVIHRQVSAPRLTSLTQHPYFYNRISFPFSPFSRYYREGAMESHLRLCLRLRLVTALLLRLRFARVPRPKSCSSPFTHSTMLQSKELPCALPPGYIRTPPVKDRGGGKLDDGVKNRLPEVKGGDGILPRPLAPLIAV